MKAFVHQGPGQFGFMDLPEPTLPQPYGVILHPVAVSPCTSDVHTMAGGGAPKKENLVMGHECVARVVEVGRQVQDFKPGDLVIVPAITPNWRAVAIQEGNPGHADDHFSGHRLGRTWDGVFAQYFALPDADTTLAHLPSELSLEQGLMCADVMTTGFTGAECAQIQTGDTVCVTGIGAIGLMAIAGAVHLGAGRVIAVGSRKLCVDLAFHYGASEVVDYHNIDLPQTILDMTGQIGPDRVIIAGGGDQIFTDAVDMVRYGIGHISNINYYGGTGSLSFPKFSGGRGMAGKTIHTELAKGGRARIQRMAELVKYRRVDPSPLVTHHLKGLDAIPQAIDLMRDKEKHGAVKVMVELG